MKKISLDRVLYLSILFMPFTFYISGILLIYLFFKTYNISKNVFHLPYKIKLFLFLFLFYNFIQGLFLVHLLNHYVGLLANYLVFIIFFSVLSKIITNNYKLEVLKKQTIYSSFIMSIIGILIYLLSKTNWFLFDYLSKNFINIEFYTDRASGISMNPNILSIYIILGIFLSLGYDYKYNNNNKKPNFILYNIFLNKKTIILTQFICLFLTYSRGIILTLLICMPMLIFSLNFRPNKMASNISKKLNFNKLIYFLPLLILIDSKWIERIINTFNFTHRESLTRLFVWEKSLNIIKDYPFGIGILNFEEFYKKYNYENFILIPHAHNWYLQTFIESGVIGGTFIFITFFYTIYYFFKNLKIEYYYIPISLISFSIFNLTDYTLWDIRIKFIFSIIIFIGFYKINKTQEIQNS